MKKIFIIAGGYSKEREISLDTSKSVFKELSKTKKYKIKIDEPDGELVNKLRKFKPDVVKMVIYKQYLKQKRWSIHTQEFYLHLWQWIKKYQKKSMLKIKY